MGVSNICARLAPFAFPRHAIDCQNLWEGYMRTAHRFSKVDNNVDVLQHLLWDGVGAVELEDNMGVEDVLDAKDAVLCLLLRQLLCRAGLEQLPVHCKLWNGSKLGRVVCSGHLLLT